MQISRLAFAATAALSALAAHAEEAGVNLGVLTCRMDGITNTIVYTKEEFACEFKPVEGEVQSYTGVIKQVGVNLSFTSENTLVWAVLVPSLDVVSPDLLRGTYVGASTQVELGAGVSANVLIGGGKKHVTLQPVSFSGMVGAGAALGLTEFELR